MTSYSQELRDRGAAAKAPARRFSWSGLTRRPEFGAFIATVLVYGFFAATAYDAGFATFDGTAGWMNTSAELGIIAIPVGLLMVAGEFDLSVGAVVGASSITVAIGTTLFGLSIWPMIAAALALGVAVGLLNGFLVVRTGLPSFIVTLASSFSVGGLSLGLARVLSNTTSVSVKSPPLADSLFAATWGQANIAILWWFAVTLLGGWALARTPFGNWIFATGGNPVAARGAGVPTGLVKTALFVATGAGAALVGVIQAVEYHSGNATAGLGYVFQAPIVAVIGGVLLGGGYGSAFGVFLGTVIFGVINIGIFYTGWSTDWVQLFLGVLLMLAVLTNHYFRRLAMSSS
ncbi:ABC transporter permease [Labrys monachus]|uniref:Xylose transport system permease protein XylH n=1 Tax=Labrys monachus TaxID=217067 RepID=A0ABU0FH04_9HYPH|nr:ABC transporter permease [Labrys monachus]MDQ0393617.1 simple sugar transport system permease protein [Labrys monachus]